MASSDNVSLFLVELLSFRNGNQVPPLVGNSAAGLKRSKPSEEAEALQNDQRCLQDQSPLSSALWE